MYTFTVQYNGEDTLEAAKLYHELLQIKTKSSSQTKLIKGHTFNVILDMKTKDLERKADEAAEEYAKLVEQHGEKEAIYL